MGETVVKMLGSRSRAAKRRDPLEPLASFTRFILVGMLTLLGVAVFALFFGHGSILGYGQTDICVDNGGEGGSSGDGTDIASHFHAHAGTSLVHAGYEACVFQAPSAAQRWWYTLEHLPGMLTAIVVAVAIYSALHQAEQHGLYAAGMAARIRFLAWFLIADFMIGPLVTHVAKHRLWVSMVDGPIQDSYRPHWPFLFIGLALLSLARIMRVGTAMREDLEGVV